MLEKDWERADAWLAEALDVAAGSGASAELARAYLDAARLRSLRGAAGDASAARAFARRARDLAGQLAMPFVERGAAELEQSLGEEPALAHGVVQDERARIQSIALGTPDGVPRSDGRALGRWLREFLARVERGESPRTPGPAAEAAPGDADLVILMTDLVGSTELLERLGATDALASMHRHNAILRRCLAAHGGTEIQHTGDGVLASFLAAPDALRCAVAIQRDFATDARAGGTPLRVRVGIAAGRVLYEEGRLFGTPVNAAARLCAAADAEQILVSDAVRVAGAASGIGFRELGAVRFKGFQEAIPVHAATW
jgi:class 3 adenylate cyclase